MNKQLHTFTGMSEVKANYVASRLTDTQFAEHISVGGQQYSCAQVRAWRQALGIPNNKAIDGRDHKIIELKNTLNEVWAELQRWYPIEGGLLKEEPELVKSYEEAMK